MSGNTVNMRLGLGTSKESEQGGTWETSYVRISKIETCALAGVGSTRPEELRELRRKQLSREKESVTAQLEKLATSRTRLEAAILTAETVAYQQSAQGSRLFQMLTARSGLGSWWLTGGLVAILGFGALIILHRRLTRV